MKTKFLFLIFLLITALMLSLPLCHAETPSTERVDVQSFENAPLPEEVSETDTDTIHKHEHSDECNEYFNAVWRAPIMVPWIKKRTIIISSLFILLLGARMLKRALKRRAEK